MRRNGKYGYLAKNTALFSISSFGSKILTFLLVPLYTSVLSTSEYGIADLISTSAILLGYIFTLNIGDALLRFAIDKDNPINMLSYGLKLILKGTLLVCCGMLLVRKVGIISWPGYCFMYMEMYYLGLQISSLLNNYLRAVDNVKAVAVAGLITTALTIFSNVILLLFFKLRLAGYLLSMVIGVIGTCFYQIIVIHVPIKKIISIDCDKTLKIEMLRYSVPLIFNGIAWWINSSLDKYFITLFLGTSAAGIYAVSYKIPTLLTMVQTIFNQAWNLSAIKEFDKDDSDGFFSKTYSVYNAGLILVCSLLIIFNIPIAKILFAKKFFEAWRYAPLLLIATLFSTMSGFIGSVFSAVKNSKVYAVSTVVAALVNTILNAIMIPIWGISGAAIATLIAFFIIWVVRLICSKKYIKWHVNFVKDIFAYLLLTIQAVEMIYFNKGYIVGTILLIVLFIMYYSSLNILFRGIKKKVMRK